MTMTPNQALQRTRHGVVVGNHCVPWAGSLSWTLGISMRLGIFALLFLLVGCASAPPRVVTDEHLLGVGDRLVIVIINRESPDIREAVDASGSISMPFVGKLHVAGMDLEQAARTIETAYFPSCFREPIKVRLSKL